MILLWEWQRGFFMKAHKDKQRKIIKKKLKETEPEKL